MCVGPISNLLFGIMSAGFASGDGQPHASPVSPLGHGEVDLGNGAEEQGPALQARLAEQSAKEAYLILDQRAKQISATLLREKPSEPSPSWSGQDNDVRTSGLTTFHS